MVPDTNESLPSPWRCRMRKFVGILAALLLGAVLGLSGSALAHQASPMAYGPTLSQKGIHSGAATTSVQAWTNVPGLAVGNLCPLSAPAEVSATVTLVPFPSYQYNVRVLIGKHVIRPISVPIGWDYGSSATF